MNNAIGRTMSYFLSSIFFENFFSSSFRRFRTRHKKKVGKMSDSATLRGQVIHKRQVSKKLVFFDVSETDSGTRRAAILKSWISGPDVMIQALKGGGKIHVGDTVRFHGDDSSSGQNEDEVVVKSFEVKNAQIYFF